MSSTRCKPHPATPGLGASDPAQLSPFTVQCSPFVHRNTRCRRERETVDSAVGCSRTVHQPNSGPGHWPVFVEYAVTLLLLLLMLHPTRSKRGDRNTSGTPSTEAWEPGGSGFSWGIRFLGIPFALSFVIHSSIRRRDKWIWVLHQLDKCEGHTDINATGRIHHFTLDAPSAG